MKVAGRPNIDTRTAPRADANDIASAYVSPLILRALAERPDASIPWIEKVSGTLLMADISGFTSMSERLAEAGREGAEMLTDIINRYFTAMIDAAHNHGGHNLKFGGDALLLFFDGPGHAERAARTALEMQRENKKQPGLRIGRERHKPSVSIGVHSGEFWSAAVGEPETRLQHVIFGDDVNRVVDAEGAASAGEVMATQGVIGADWVVEDHGEFRLISLLPATANRGPVPEEAFLPSGVDVEAYLPPPVLWALRGHGSASAGEHRGVVVMFIHTTGFEDLAEDWGSEAALGQLQEYTGKLVRLTEQYGGFLASNDIYFEGVKFIVVFGAPIAREEDSANALRLALALDEWLGQSGLALRHRIGINGGNAFAGDIGAPYRREYTVMGDCVNLSARLMSAAETGQTLVSAATAGRAGAGFVFRDLPAIRVKGKSDEIAIKALAGVDASTTVTTVNQQTPFIGRTRELERLREICLRVEGGTGQALLLKGDAGTGKSRLLLETMQYARARGWPVHQGRCFSHSSGSPFAPWTQILSSVLGIQDQASRENQDRAVIDALELICPDHAPLAALLNPLLGLALAPSEAVMAMDEETRGQRLLDLLSAIIAGAATEVPVLVVIDDMHHADESSIDLARRVQSDAVNSRVLLAAGERAPGRNIFGPRSGATIVNIGPLNDDEADRLARLALGRRAAQPAALDVLLGRARGNPLFIEEVARSIREVPGLAEQLAANDADAKVILEGLVPDRLQNLMMSRIDRLEPGLREVVKAAAVVGSDIQADVVGPALRVMGTTGDPGPSLSRLAAEGVLTFDSQRSHYNFIHALIQEVAYGNLSFTMRRSIHGSIAQKVESRSSDLAPMFEILAHHYGRSGNKNKTLEYSLKAGDKARGVFANDDAIRHYRRATGLLSEVSPEPETVVSAYTRLGDVLGLTVRHKAAISSYAGALEACLGRRLNRMTDPGSLGLGRAATGRSAAMRSLAADVCRKIGYVCDRQSDYPRALAWFEQSLEVLPTTGGGSRGSSFIGLAGILYRAGRFDEAAGWAAKGLRSLAASGISSELAHANNLLGVIYRDQGLLAKAIAHRLRALAMYEELGHLGGQADTLNNLGLDYFSNGHWEDAVSRFQSCREISERIGDPDGVAIVRNNAGEVYLAQGDLDLAEAEFKAAAEASRRLGNVAVAGLAEANLGEAMTIEGQLPEAREILRRSIKTLRRLGAQTLVMEAEVRLAELHFAARDYYAAETLSNKLVQASRKIEARPIEGRALRLLGQLAARRKRWGEAEGLFQASIKLFADTGATHGAAKSRLALAQALDRPAEARKALRVFIRLGASRDAEEVEAILAL